MRKQEREEMEFPDEVETPLDIPARERFARYRGLQNFRTSPWDPYESLPLEYGRIVQVCNENQSLIKILSFVMVCTLVIVPKLM